MSTRCRSLGVAPSVGSAGRVPLVFGGHDLGVAERAADLYADGIAPLIVVSGGSRAVPDGSEFATEADALADVLLRRDIPKDAIALERLASNTSENFWLPAELLRNLGLDPHKLLSECEPTFPQADIADTALENRG